MHPSPPLSRVEWTPSTRRHTVTQQKFVQIKKFGKLEPAIACIHPCLHWYTNGENASDPDMDEEPRLQESRGY